MQGRGCDVYANRNGRVEDQASCVLSRTRLPACCFLCSSVPRSTRRPCAAAVWALLLGSKLSDSSFLIIGEGMSGTAGGVFTKCLTHSLLTTLQAEAVIGDGPSTSRSTGPKRFRLSSSQVHCDMHPNCVRKCGLSQAITASQSSCSGQHNVSARQCLGNCQVSPDRVRT